MKTRDGSGTLYVKSWYTEVSGEPVSYQAASDFWYRNGDVWTSAATGTVLTAETFAGIQGIAFADPQTSPDTPVYAAETVYNTYADASAAAVEKGVAQVQVLGGKAVAVTGIGNVEVTVSNATGITYSTGNVPADGKITLTLENTSTSARDIVMGTALYDTAASTTAAVSAAELNISGDTIINKGIIMGGQAYRDTPATDANILMQSDVRTAVLNMSGDSTVSGDIFAGGCAVASSQINYGVSWTVSANITEKTTVNISGGTVSQSVYGGSYLYVDAFVQPEFSDAGKKIEETGTTEAFELNITGGTFQAYNAASVTHGIYGGGMVDASGPYDTTGGGPFETHNTLTTKTSVINISGGTFGSAESAGKYNIYGGGYIRTYSPETQILYPSLDYSDKSATTTKLYATSSVDNVSITIGGAETATVIYGDVYAGGRLDADFTVINPNIVNTVGSATITIGKNAVINGDVNGGGTYNATVDSSHPIWNDGSISGGISDFDWIILGEGSKQLTSFVNADGAVNMNYKTDLSVTGEFKAKSIMVAMDGATDVFYKLVDAGTAADYGIMSVKPGAEYQLRVIDNDLYALQNDVAASGFFVDGTLTGDYEFGEKVSLSDGGTAYYGITAFSSIAEAAANAPDGQTITVLQGDYTQADAVKSPGAYKLVNQGNISSTGGLNNVFKSFELENKGTITGVAIETSMQATPHTNTVLNEGTMTNSSGYVIQSAMTLTVDNRKEMTASGGNVIDLRFEPAFERNASIANSGTISSDQYAIGWSGTYFYNGGNNSGRMEYEINNLEGGVISGTKGALKLDMGGGTKLTNSGTINGDVLLYTYNDEVILNRDSVLNGALNFSAGNDKLVNHTTVTGMVTGTGTLSLSGSGSFAGAVSAENIVIEEDSVLTFSSTLTAKSGITNHGQIKLDTAAFSAPVTEAVSGIKSLDGISLTDSKNYTLLLDQANSKVYVTEKSVSDTADQISTEALNNSVILTDKTLYTGPVTGFKTNGSGDGISAVITSDITSAGSEATQLDLENAGDNVVITGTISGSDIAGTALNITNKGTLTGGTGTTGEERAISVDLSKNTNAGNVVISNGGHLNADVKTNGTISITNTAPNTLIGNYDGQSIDLQNGPNGRVTDAVFTATGSMDLKNDGIVEKSVFTAGTAITLDAIDSSAQNGGQYFYTQFTADSITVNKNITIDSNTTFMGTLTVNSGVQITVNALSRDAGALLLADGASNADYSSFKLSEQSSGYRLAEDTANGALYISGNRILIDGQLGTGTIVEDANGAKYINGASAFNSVMAVNGATSYVIQNLILDKKEALDILVSQVGTENISYAGNVYLTGFSKITETTDLNGVPGVKGTSGNDSLTIAKKGTRYKDAVPYSGITDYSTVDFDFLGGTNKVSVGTKSQLAVKSLTNVSSITVSNGTALEAGKLTVSGAVTTGTGNSTIKIGNYVSFHTASVLKSALGGTNTVTIGSNSTADMGTMTAVKSLSAGNNTSITTGTITGTDAANSIKLGTGSAATVGTVDLLGGSNSITLGAKSQMNANSLTNISSITVGNGTALESGVLIVSGAITTGGGNSKIKIGNYVNFSAASILKSVLGGTNSISIGSNSSADTGSMSAVKNLTSGSNTTVTAADITGTDAADVLKFGNNSRITLGAVDLQGGKNRIELGGQNVIFQSGSLNNIQTFKTGAGKKAAGAWHDIAKVEINGSLTGVNGTNVINIGNGGSVSFAQGGSGYGSIQESGLGGSFAITMGSGTSLDVQDISGLGSLKTGADAVLNIYGDISTWEEAASGTMTLGDRNQVTLGGTASVNKLTLGKNVTFEAEMIEAANEGEVQVSIGTGSSVTLNGVAYIGAPAPVAMTGFRNLTLGDNSQLFAKGYLTSSNSASTVKTGKNTTAFFGNGATAFFDIEFGSNLNNTLEIGSNSTFTAAGVSNVTKVNIKSGTTVSESATVWDAKKKQTKTATLKKQGFTTVTLHDNVVMNSGKAGTFAIGNFANVTLEGNLSGTATAGITLSIGSSSTLDAFEQDLSNITKLTLSNGKDYKVINPGTAGDPAVAVSVLNTVSGVTTLMAANITGTQKNDSIKIGSRANISVTGNIDLAGGKNTVSIGSGSTVKVNNLTATGGSNNITVSGKGTLVAASVGGILNLTVNSGAFLKTSALTGTQGTTDKVTVNGDLLFGGNDIADISGIEKFAVGKSGRIFADGDVISALTKTTGFTNAVKDNSNLFNLDNMVIDDNTVAQDWNTARGWLRGDVDEIDMIKTAKPDDTGSNFTKVTASGNQTGVLQVMDAAGTEITGTYSRGVTTWNITGGAFVSISFADGLSEDKKGFINYQLA